jgi:hypothetical protein
VQPSIRALDRPALARERIGRLRAPPAAAPDRPRIRRRRLATRPLAADPRLERARPERLAQGLGVVAAIGPDLGRAKPARPQLVDERQQVALFVLVSGRQPDRQGCAGAVDR